MGELGQFKRSSGSGVPKVQRGIEREEALTLRPEERGTQKLFVNANKIPKETQGRPLMDDDWVVLCQVPINWTKYELKCT